MSREGKLECQLQRPRHWSGFMEAAGPPRNPHVLVESGAAEQPRLRQQWNLICNSLATSPPKTS